MLNKSPLALSECLTEVKISLETYRDTGVMLAPKAVETLLEGLGYYVAMARVLEEGRSQQTATEARACAIDMELYVADLRRGRRFVHPDELPSREQDEATVAGLLSGKVALHPRSVYVDKNVASGGDAA